MNDIILKAENIYKSYSGKGKRKLEVLSGINLKVRKKELTIIVGSSGAGKSTLLHILGGLDKPDSGDVFISENNIFQLNDEKLSRFRNKKIGFVFQFHHLLPEFTARENVAIPKMLSGAPKNEAFQRADKLLDLVGLSDRLEHKPAELSGGEQQRIAVARAMVNDPEIIFADEPTGNLDSKNSEIIHNLIMDLQKNTGTTFLVVTHNKDLVDLGERVLEMRDGQILNQE